MLHLLYDDHLGIEIQVDLKYQTIWIFKAFESFESYKKLGVTIKTSERKRK